jgi:hypothetical protein
MTVSPVPDDGVRAEVIKSDANSAHRIGANVNQVTLSASSRRTIIAAFGGLQKGESHAFGTCLYADRCPDMENIPGIQFRPREFAHRRFQRTLASDRLRAIKGESA